MDSRKETLKKIKSLLRFHKKGLTITDIAEKLHLNRNSTAKYLEILLISGDVDLNAIGPAKLYTLSQKMPVSAMLKFAADIILLIDNEMHVLDANENALQILGTTREDLIGVRIQDIESPLIGRLSFPDVFEEIRTKGEIHREFKISLQNEDRHFRMRLIPTIFDNMDEGVTIIGEDITKQIQFEESLMISEMRYRAIVEDQIEFICRFTPKGIITFVNDAYCRYFGLQKDLILGNHHPLTLPEEDARLMKHHLASLTLENPSGTIEHRVIMPDGSVRWQFWTDHACFDANGNITEYQSVGMDTTEKQEQARKIRESEERYRMITEFSPFPISLNDRAGNFQYLNKRFIQVFGYTLADIPTELDWFSIAFPDRKERMNAIRAWKKGRGDEEQCEGKPLIFPVRCKNGTLRQIHFCPITLFNGEQFVVYEDFTDKTESERLRSVLASIVNTSDDAIDLYQSLKSSSDAR
ncbi:MAG: PAS domain-containing protein [Methanolinea sp.]|jgi:PAS domain S-box-containing protein|nr:PAS domain-containing protein [Methanolinea sp.]